MIKEFMKVFSGVVIFCCFFSCTKQHLDPVPPEGSPAPLVYISATLDNDTVYLAGGVDSYAGKTSVTDTLNHYRTFNFRLEGDHSSNSSFMISINSYQTTLSDLQSDLNSSIFIDERHYQYPESIEHFLLLAVTLTWIDSAGKKFSSATIEQTQLFLITAVEDVVFENRNYKQVSAEFDCLLEHDNSIIHLTEGKATLLFSAD